MTTDQYRAILNRLRISYVGAASVLGVSRRTAQGYAQGGNISKPVIKLMLLLDAGAVKASQLRKLT